MKNTFIRNLLHSHFKPWFWLVLLFLAAFPAGALQTPADGTCFVYPSPATGSQAWVVFNMPQSGAANIWIYNEAGDLAVAASQWEPAGLQQFPLDLTYYRRGIYFCRVVLNFDSGGSQNLALFEFMVQR
jgi:hypothetical protein